MLVILYRWCVLWRFLRFCLLRFFRFWNLKPSYKFLNKSNYPLPLFLSELESNRVCPDFTISTQSTSWIVFYYHSTKNTNIPELHKPERRGSADLLVNFNGSLCPILPKNDRFVTKTMQYYIELIIKSSLLADSPKMSYWKSLFENTIRRLASILDKNWLSDGILS